MNTLFTALFNRHAVFRAAVTSAGLLLSMTAGAAQSVNPLPAPTGPHDVGVVWRQWVDESRDETYDDETSDAKREVVVQFLYPAEAAEGAEPAPYFENATEVLPEFARLMDAFVAVPVETRGADFANFVSHAYPDAPISDDQESYPVVIFTHGGAADVQMYTAMLEELASHGYIVAAINHTYGAARTVLLDGTVALPTYSTGLEDAINIWSVDQIFVMDQLEALNTDDPDGMFTGRIDLERIGVMGHSLGASAATMTCFVDARCKALANSDGGALGDVIEEGLDQPVLHLITDDVDTNPAIFDNVRGPYYGVHFNGFLHLNLGDFAVWPKKESLIDVDWLSETDGERSVELTRAAVVAFFDQYLKGDGESSMDDLSAYPEIDVTSRNVETTE